jgi:phage shock protein A
MLIAQNRRARATVKANAARGAALGQKDAAVARLKDSVARMQASNAASHILLETDSVEDRIGALEREEKIETLLRELKERQPLLSKGS